MLKKLLFFIFLGFLNTSSAILELELNSGVCKRTPIAISVSNHSSNFDISEVIANDLHLIGEFIAKKRQSYYAKKLFNGANINELSVPKKTDYFMAVNVESENGKYIVKAQFFDLYAKRKMLFNKKLIIEAHQFRQVSHHLSDLMYEAATGVNGVFSTKIAYVHRTLLRNKTLRYSLKIADMDGHNVKTLLESCEPIMSLSFAPNGKSIAYVSFEKRRAEIYTIELATAKRSLLTSFKGLNGAPSFSPRGDKLAIVLSVSGYPNIYVYDIHNKSVARVTNSKSIDTEPVWSLDGKELYFASDRANGRLHIYKTELATKKVTRVTYEGGYNASPRMASDGKKIVVLHKNDEGFNLAVQNLTDKSFKVITNGGGIEDPSISPNGKMVLFSNSKRSKKILQMVTISGHALASLPSSNGDMLKPTWSPL